MIAAGRGADPEGERGEGVLHEAGAVSDNALTVMTYNLGAGLAKPRRLVELLRRSEADVVGFQELAPDQAAVLEEGLGNLFPFRLLHPLGIPGKGLLSRFPLRDDELVELFPGRPDARVTVETPAGPVTVVVAHPPPPRLGRRWGENAAAAEQVARVVELATGGEPAVVLADVNRVRWQAAYRRLAGAGLVDAFARAGRGRGATTPVRLVAGGARLPLPPFLRIDYVWHTRHFRALAAWTGEDAGSDHLPVLARLVRVDGGEDRGPEGRR